MTNQNITSPALLSPEPTSWLGLCTRVTAAEALAVAASQPPLYMRCVFLFRVFYNFQWREEARSLHFVLGLPPASKSSYLLMTNQNINTPSPLSPEPTSWLWLCTWVTAAEAWLSRHRRQRHTCRVCFCLKVSYIFRGEKKRSLYTARPPATKSPFLLMTNQNITSPTHFYQNHPPDSGSVHESQQQQVWLSLHGIHSHTYCVRFCHTSSTWREAAQLICLAALRFLWRLPFENLRPRFCQEGTFPAIWKSWEDF